MGVVEPITSPTFTLIAEYHPPSPAPPLYHIDVYRLDEAVHEAMALGLDDYLLGDGVCLIEWADRISSALPGERLWITLRHLDISKRGLVVQRDRCALPGSAARLPAGRFRVMKEKDQMLLAIDTATHMAGLALYDPVQGMDIGRGILVLCQ